jgi:hypothetical protein
VVKDRDPQIAPIPQIFEFKSAKSADLIRLLVAGMEKDED